MSQLRKENTDRKASTQALIPYKTMLPDGTCHIGGKKYSQTVEFYDTNYQLATFDEKAVSFLRGVIFSITSMTALNFKIHTKIKSLIKTQ